ncbi:helix-turn-helix transcriptional regulator [Thauera butanivorans]|uniref:Transcriptional regulator n=1 Tax=Thauera butanivorans TaxID=86174 RepID=A7MAQ8_9RHOO|nr:winged helix-turn-helix transcriptional regulator [Thauera butanivorans]ABU68841.2 unknown [Thauera butanivorans]
MLAILGTRQRELLKLLLRSKGGLTVVELSARLGISSNAVRQHLAALENEGLVAHGESRPSGGRPEQLYVLTAAGKELFPRQYSWFAQLVVESMKQEAGAEATRERLAAMGSGIARLLLRQHGGLEGRRQRVAKLAELMEALGYEIGSVDAEGKEPVIEANNCVFHKLAMDDPDICEFDLALLSTFTDSKVDHQECIAKGGNVCRFRFSRKR